MTLTESEKRFYRLARRYLKNLLLILDDLGVSPPNDEPKPSLPPNSTGEAQASPVPSCEADQLPADTPASRNLNRGTASNWEVHTFYSFQDCNEFCLELCQDGRFFQGPNTIKTNQGTDIEEIKYQVLVLK